MVLVTGASGFVGHKIMEMYKNSVAAPSLRSVTQEDIHRMVEESGADVIVHTAAISDIGACQADPGASYYANVQLPLMIAKASKDRKLICFSSDQVYGGCPEEGPYSEEMAKPGNIYAEHKLEMENRVLEAAPGAVMLRAEWMYDYDLHKMNYFMQIINAAEEVSFSSRQFRGVTYLKEAVENLEKAAALPGGVYNFGCETKQSMYDITRDFLISLSEISLNEISMGRISLGKKVRLKDAPARHNLWMNCEKAKKHGMEFGGVLDGLLRCAADCNQD